MARLGLPERTVGFGAILREQGTRRGGSAESASSAAQNRQVELPLGFRLTRTDLPFYKTYKLIN